MTNQITLKLQNSIIDIFKSLKNLKSECEDIEKVYFSTGVSAYIAGLASGTTAATVGSLLSKQEIIDGITLCQQLKNFMIGSVVTQSDYDSTLQNIAYADSSGATNVPQAAEGIGQRIKKIASDLIKIHSLSKDVDKVYFVNEINVLMSANANKTVFGANCTVAELGTAINTLQQLRYMINNQAVTTGAYLDNILLWERFLS